MLKQTKELNIPHQNFVKTEQELEKAIAEIKHKYRGSIFGNDSEIYEGYLKKFKSID